MANLKGVTHQGEVVDKDAPGAAHIVDMDEDTAQAVIQGIKDRYARENPSLERSAQTMSAHLAVNGVAVPVSPDDTETPQQKLVRLENEGVLHPHGVIATTQGFKTEEELGVSGLGVTDAPVHMTEEMHEWQAPPEPQPQSQEFQPEPAPAEESKSADNAGTDGVFSGEGDQNRSPDESALIEGLSEPVAQKLFDAGITSRAQLAEKSDVELGGIPGIGPASIEKIKGFLAS